MPDGRATWPARESALDGTRDGLRAHCAVPPLCSPMSSPAAMSSDTETPKDAEQPSSDFISNILTPGSSLHPTFLLILNCAFAFLLFVFLVLLVLTRGNFHIFVLIGIEGCLWASVQWYVVRPAHEILG